MEGIAAFSDLRQAGRLKWAAGPGAWQAEPEDVVQALTGEGFEECKREILRGGRNRAPAGGVWQGLNARTGAVASAIWVRTGEQRPLVFIDIDGRRVEDHGA